jgi:hypothetical protein
LNSLLEANNMKLTAKPLAVLIFVFIFGGIAFTTALGWWQTTTTKVPVKYTEGEATGQYNPADIRGSYKFGEISSLFEIPLSDLQNAFHLPADVNPADYQVKSLEAQFAGLPGEIGTTSIRFFVAFYKGLPFGLSEDIYLPLEAVTILKQKAPLSPDQFAYLDSHTINLDQPAVPVTANTPASQATLAPPPSTPTTDQANAQPAATEHAAPDRTITGKTTFQDMLDWGVTQAAIEQAISSPMPEPAIVIREYYSSKGLEFSSAKGALQALVDQVK